MCAVLSRRSIPPVSSDVHVRTHTKTHNQNQNETHTFDNITIRWNVMERGGPLHLSWAHALFVAAATHSFLQIPQMETVMLHCLLNGFGCVAIKIATAFLVVSLDVMRLICFCWNTDALALLTLLNL